MERQSHAAMTAFPHSIASDTGAMTRTVFLCAFDLIEAPGTAPHHKCSCVHLRMCGHSRAIRLPETTVSVVVAESVVNALSWTGSAGLLVAFVQQEAQKKDGKSK